MLLHEPRENAETTLHASSYLEPSSNTTITEYGTPHSSLREGDSVNAVYPAKSYQNDPRDICFKCFARGRKALLCPCKDRSEDDPHFGLLAKDNYAKLTYRQREWIRSLGRSPRWLFVNSGSCPKSFVRDSVTPQNASASNVAGPASNPPLTSDQVSEKSVSFMTAQRSPATKKLSAGGLDRPLADPHDDDVAPEPPPLRIEVHPRKWIDIQEREARKQDEERPVRSCQDPLDYQSI